MADQTGTGTPPGGSGSQDVLSIIASLGQSGLLGGGGNSSPTLNDSPWDVSFGLDSPVYLKQKASIPEVEGPGGQANRLESTQVVQSDKTGQQFLMDMAKGMDPHGVSELQARLAKLGLLAPDTYNVGDGTDQGTMNAMAGVLRVAALKGMTPFDALDYLEKVTPKSQTLAGKEAAAKQSDAQAAQKAAYDSYLGNLNSVYMRTWGVPAPPGYVDRAAKSGMNIYEFEAHERSKPAFETSAQGQTERLNLESQIAQWMGRA